ncbi:hypothetical protein NDA03_25930 [Trichocoleus sp. Lan]|uniref:surface-adhesin E family protein n=1 Tax=Trichocoleus sp. Lan TaxID=2933927 RepID=UPI0032994BD8
MKKFLLPAIATVLVTLPAIAAPVWELVGKAENSQLYVDKTSVVKRVRGKSTLAWYTSRISYSSPSPEGWKEMIIFSSANCTARLQRQRMVVVFDQTGEEIGRTEDGDAAPLVAVPRGSAAGSALSYACR